MFPALQFIKRKIRDFESKQTGNVREHSSVEEHKLSWKSNRTLND